MKLPVLVVLNLCTFTSVLSQEDCRTPRGRDGVCTVLPECSQLYMLLKRRPISSADAEYLRASHCGFVGSLPKVCCPSGEGPFTQAPSRPTAYPDSTSSGEDNVSRPDNILPSKNECGVDTQNRIYGGEKADLDEFPWMALVEYERPNRQRGFYCGGVLISKKYILTAAHCVKGKDLPKDWKVVGVRLGEYDTEQETDCINYGFTKDCAPPPQNVAVESFIAHEQYDPFDTNQYHDIALLRLAREVEYTEFVKPICLPSTNSELQRDYTGKKLFVAGWGKTENRSESNIKLKLSVPVKGNAECTRTYSAANVRLEKGQMCAGGQKGKDSCRGDSGGPLMSLNSENGDINWYSVGIVSFGPSPCGMENWPGVYTKVANYVNWIFSKLKP